MTFDEARKVQQIRWFNLAFKPAVEKLLAKGKISKYIAEKLLEPALHLERKRIPKAVIPQASYMADALEVADDGNLLLQGHQRSLPDAEDGQDGPSVSTDDGLRKLGANQVPETVQAPERRNSAPVQASQRVCGHIWTCACQA